MQDPRGRWGKNPGSSSVQRREVMALAVQDWETVRHATPEQVAFYRENGYLKFGRIFTSAEMEALREHVDQMIAALPEGKRPEEMDRPHFEDAWLFRYLADPRVLDVI